MRKKESESISSIEKQIKVLKNNVEIILPDDGLEKKLKKSIDTGQQLRIKLGLDPTAPDLHLGHVVVLKKLRDFQKLGHNIILIVGDFTARIGDPSGKNKTRPPLSEKQIKNNTQTYVDQVSKIIDISKVEIRYNSEWFNERSLAQLLDLTSRVTLNQILHRSDFRTRYDSGLPIGLHELLYPVMQAYDSVILKADVEIGGTDQLFNCSLGRELQQTFKQSPQIVFGLPLLRGTDGSIKMGKSQGNYIAINEAPKDMYGKIMSIPDKLIPDYVKLVCTFTPEEEKEIIDQLLINKDNPMVFKKRVAYNLVEEFYGDKEAGKCSDFFYKQIQSRNPKKITYDLKYLSDYGELTDEKTLLDLCHVLHPDKSRGAIRRLFKEGGICIGEEKIEDCTQKIINLPPSFKLKIGKRNFYEIVKWEKKHGKMG